MQDKYPVLIAGIHLFNINIPGFISFTMTENGETHKR
jgi:hypothetical protein